MYDLFTEQSRADFRVLQKFKAFDVDNLKKISVRKFGHRKSRILTNENCSRKKISNFVKLLRKKHEFVQMAAEKNAKYRQRTPQKSTFCQKI